jgi:hypothetical protein
MKPHSRVRASWFPAAVFPALLLALAAPAEAFALGDWIGVEPNLWRQSLKGTAAIHDGSGGGTTFDFQDTLGIEEDDSARVGRVWFRLGKSRLFLDYSDTSRDGSAVLGADLDFHGITYSGGETVTTDLDLTLLQATYRYTFDFKLIEVGVGAGFHVARVDLEMVGSSTGTERLDESVPYPTLSAAFAVKPFPGFRIRAEASGVSATVSGNDIDILDARAQIEYYFAHVLGLYAGYRSYRFNLDAEDFGVVDATSKGPYVGFGLKF